MLLKVTAPLPPEAELKPVLLLRYDIKSAVLAKGLPSDCNISDILN